MALLPQPRSDYGHLFGRVHGRGFNGWSKCKALLDAKLIGMAPWTLHDLRRSVATNMGELGIADDVIGRVLDHAPQGVTRIHYNHSQKLAAVRAALECWSPSWSGSSAQRRRGRPRPTGAHLTCL